MVKEYFVSEAISLKNFTDNACAPASFCFRILLKNKDIRVNGLKVSSDLPLKAGDRVQYYLTPVQEARQGFSIIYEDDNVTVVDKESGVNSEAVFSALRETGQYYFLHRLDRNTAGLLLFARTKEAEEELLRAFREKRIEKVYHARVVGHMEKSRSVERAFLNKDKERSLVRVGGSIGERIITEYEVLKEEGETSLLRIVLHTGKTHQIRAHLAYLSHPVVGDCKYGDMAFNRARHLTRQQLVAKELVVHAEGELAYLGERRFVSDFSL